MESRSLETKALLSLDVPPNAIWYMSVTEGCRELGTPEAGLIPAWDAQQKEITFIRLHARQETSQDGIRTRAEVSVLLPHPKLPIKSS